MLLDRDPCYGEPFHSTTCQALPLTIVVWDELIESNRFLSWLHTARAETFVALRAVIAIAILPVRM
jgi:hypothetical protein